MFVVPGDQGKKLGEFFGQCTDDHFGLWVCLRELVSTALVVVNKTEQYSLLDHK